MSDIEKTPEKIFERLDVKEQVIELKKRLVKLEARFAEYEDLIEQWEKNFKERKPEINLETVES